MPLPPLPPELKSEPSGIRGSRTMKHSTRLRTIIVNRASPRRSIKTVAIAIRQSLHFMPTLAIRYCQLGEDRHGLDLFRSDNDSPQPTAGGPTVRQRIVTIALEPDPRPSPPLSMTISPESTDARTVRYGIAVSFFDFPFPTLCSFCSRLLPQLPSIGTASLPRIPAPESCRNQ
jgi:hypothetical protein